MLKAMSGWVDEEFIALMSLAFRDKVVLFKAYSLQY